ncbi:unnamed protein product [Pedinophyceae sp. YPF-701]|nr:unnamed protein product [Pedinophyceae sp. YPF-701]
MEALKTAEGRGKSGVSPEQAKAIQDAVDFLEREIGVPDPVTDPGLEGRWELLYTSRPGTASPIQRAFTGNDAFTVYQEIILKGTPEDPSPRVNNVVDFGKGVGELRVEAEASTDAQPLDGFVARKGDGGVLGLYPFGRSISTPPVRTNMRLDFQFDSAAFRFDSVPFKIPYPVPFRLLGDESKGWIDVTYLSDDREFRLTRGNKGTLFILRKGAPKGSGAATGAEAAALPPRERIAKFVAGDLELSQAEVLRMVEELAAINPTPAPARSELSRGKWRQRWSAQANNSNPLQKASTASGDNFQIIEETTLTNDVAFGSWLQLRAEAACRPLEDARTGVTIDGADLKLFGNTLRLGGVKGEGWIDWLYLDDEIRVTRGNKGSTFIHTRE